MGQPIVLPAGTAKKVGSISPSESWQLLHSPRGNHFCGVIETQNYMISVEDDRGLVPASEVAWCLANGWK